MIVCFESFEINNHSKVGDYRIAWVVQNCQARLGHKYGLKNELLVSCDFDYNNNAQ